VSDIAWATPPTFVSGNALTAAQLNILSGDLNETAPAKATAEGQLFVATAGNTIAARLSGAAYVATAQSTTSTAYTNLTTIGPQVTVTHGTRVLVLINLQMQNNTIGGRSVAAPDLTGANVAAPQDSTDVMLYGAVANFEAQVGGAVLYGALTAGSTTFTLQYKVTSGTGTFTFRRMAVIPF